MGFDYLKSDTKRIERKLEELNKRYDDVELQKKIDEIDERCKEIKATETDDFKEQIWTDIYTDVLKLEKKQAKKYKTPKKRRNQRRINEFQTIFYLNTN